jgi:Zn-dependent M28 family amino/carboxypeptidase
MRWRCLLLIMLCLAASAGCASDRSEFDGKRALKHVAAQCDLGPRPVGSEANRETSDYVARELQRNGWEVEYHEFVHQTLPVRNVIGKKGSGPVIILATHYDTSPRADKDPTNRSLPVMGANDGGSGTGVLLELSRVLDAAATDQAEIWLVFFDAENHGGIQNWDWCIGSEYFAAEVASRPLTEQPKYTIVVDMIGDSEQELYYEWNSTLWLQEKVWGVAADLGYQAQFVPEHRHSTINDHLSFLGVGLPAAVIADLDYPYWRTRYDTLDKISVDSLQRVGEVLETLLEDEPFRIGPDER